MRLNIKTISALSLREKIILLLVICALGYLGFDFLLYQPKTTDAENIKKELEAIEQKTQENYAYIVNPESITQEIRLLEKRVRFFEGKFADAEPPGRLLEQIAKLCKKMNIEIMSLKPTEKTLPTMEFQQVSVAMDVRSDFKTTVRLLGAIKTLPALTIVEAMDIQGGGDTPLVTMHVVLNSFFRLQSDTTGS